MLNVVTGVFCHDAIQSASKDTSNVIQSHMESLKKYIETLRHIFSEMDMDASGTVTIAE